MSAIFKKMPVSTRTSLSSQSWQPAKSSKSLKDTLEQRVNAFFSQDTHKQLHNPVYLDWIQHTEVRKSQWDLRILLEVVKRIPLSTVKFVSNSAAYKDRLHFSYPFKPEMEHSILKTPPSSPATTLVTPTELQSERSPELLTTDSPQNSGTPNSNATTVPNTETPQEPTLPVDSAKNAQDSPNLSQEVFTPLQTLDTSILTPESNTQGDTQDTEKGVTGRFITNRIQTIFQQQFQEQFKQSFHEQFQESMNTYSDTLDGRIRHVVDEALDDLHKRKVIPYVKTSVQELFTTTTNATIESLIDDKIDDQIRTNMEQSSIAILETQAKTLSDSVLNDIIKPEVNNIVQTTKDDLTRNVLTKIQGLRNVVNTAKDELNRTTSESVKEIQTKSNKVTQLISTFTTTHSDFARKARNDLNEASEKIMLDLSKDANQHLEYIAQESADALQNFADIASDRTISLKRSLAENLSQAKDDITASAHFHINNMRTWFDANSQAFKAVSQSQPTQPEMFKQDQLVFYTKNENSTPTPVTIAAVHRDDEDELFYTIQFPTGSEVQTVSERLSLNKPNKSRFEDADVQENQNKIPLNSFYQKKNTNNRYLSHQAQSKTQYQRHRDSHPQSKPVAKTHAAPIYVDLEDYDDEDPVEVVQNQATGTPRATGQQFLKETEVIRNGPTPYMVTQFHKQFKAKVENKDMILTFYQQLHAQGKPYGIYIIDLKEVRQDCDLCPDNIPPVARNAMQIALYQKLQDVDCISYDFKEAQNQIDAYSNTSDGFATLYQMLRMVHPHLMEGTKMYNAPKLSEAKDLFQYAAMCRNYILFQEIQQRTYTEKEQSEMFLQNVDDPDYSAGRAQCITELAVATLDGTSNVRISNMKFSNLPMTLQQYNNKLNLSNNQPIVRAIQKPPFQRNAYKNNATPNRIPRRSNYEPYLCMGCGLWGHKVTKCKNVPKVAIALEYIKNKPRHVQKLVSEFKRVNDKSTKRTTVRVLQTNGMLENYEDPETYLNDNDIDVPMEETPLVNEE